MKRWAASWLLLLPVKFWLRKRKVLNNIGRWLPGLSAKI